MAFIAFIVLRSYPLAVIRGKPRSLRWGGLNIVPVPTTFACLDCGDPGPRGSNFVFGLVSSLLGVCGAFIVSNKVYNLD